MASKDARRRYRIWAWLLLLVLPGIARLPLCRDASLAFADQLFLIGAARPIRPVPIVIIGIGDKSLEAWNADPQIAFPVHYARITKQAGKDKVNGIGFDTVLAFDVDTYLTSMGIEDNDCLPFRSFARADRATGSRAFIGVAHAPGALKVLEPAKFLKIAFPGRIGLLDVLRSSDQCVRVFPLQEQGETENVSALSTLLASHYLGLDPSKDVQPAFSGTWSHGNASWLGLNYPNLVFRQIEASDYESGDSKFKIPAGSIVLVGATDSGSQDVHLTYGRESVPGVVLQARAVATLLNRASVKTIEDGAPSIWGIGAVTLALFLMGKRGWVACLLVPIALVAAAIVMAGRAHIVLVLWPIVASLLPPLLCSAMDARFEAGLRGRIQRLFGQQLSPEIAQYVMERTDGHIEPAETSATVLFFDVRGSTALAEQHGPNEAVRMLNELYEAVVPVIARHGGLVNRMLGDGFVAVFGVPYPLENHALAAFRAGEAIQAEVASLNKDRGTNWRCGIGIQTGKLVAGNVGSKDRSEFTVIGDTVNVASRLEGLCKPLDACLVISKAVWESAGRPPDLEGPVYREISGRSESVEVCFRRNPPRTEASS